MPVEAQACGTPVVALGRGGALETVDRRRRPGLLVDDADRPRRSPTRSRGRPLGFDRQRLARMPSASTASASRRDLDARSRRAAGRRRGRRDGEAATTGCSRPIYVVVDALLGDGGLPRSPTCAVRSGLIPVTKGHPAASGSTSRRCRSSASLVPLALPPPGALPAAARPDARRRLLRRPRRQHPRRRARRRQHAVFRRTTCPTR